MLKSLQMGMGMGIRFFGCGTDDVVMAAITTAVPISSLHLPVRPLRHISRPRLASTGLASYRRRKTRTRTWDWVCSAITMARMVSNNTTTTHGDIGSAYGGDGSGEADAISISGLPVASSNSPSKEIGSTLNQMSKWIIVAIFSVAVLWKHDAEIIWIVIGSVINTWFSATLKKMLNHPRPVPHIKPDPGMPSSHSQSIFYTAIITILSLFHWLGINTITVIAGTLTLASSSYLASLRVSEQYHSVDQVVVGAVLGSTFATMWIWSWHTFVSNAFISSIWVRSAVVSSFVVSGALFGLHIIKHWLKDDQ